MENAHKRGGPLSTTGIAGAEWMPRLICTDSGEIEQACTFHSLGYPCVDLRFEETYSGPSLVYLDQ